MTYPLTTVVILDLLLVFLYLAVELIDQTINRSVEVFVNGLDEDILAGQVHGDFCLLLQFFDR